MATISFILAGQQFELSDRDVRARIAKHHPEPIHQYWVDIDGNRWPVKQVLALATGLHKSDFQTQSSQRLLSKLGFTIGRGNDAITVSTDPRQPQLGKISPNPPVPPPAADVLLVGCVKRKRASGASAKDLYTSDYFAKMRAYAESTGKPWFILSAQHGLVAADEWLEPYDCYPPNMSRDYRCEWGRQVARQLEDALGTLHGRIFDIHAGASYVESVEAALSPKGAIIIDQLRGLPLGRRLSWYLQHTTAPIDIEEDLAQVSDCSRAVSLSDLLTSAGAGLRSPGIYSWWVDDAGAGELSVGLGHEIAPGLVYVGLAGATRKGGATSSNTLWGRMSTMHLGKKHEFSTLRRSLGSILADVNGQPAIDEAQLTSWMHAHLRVRLVPVANADTLDDLETGILEKLDPPLNIAKVARTPSRQRLSALRKQYAHSGRSPAGNQKT